VAIHPGAACAEKQWPLERFLAVAAALRERAPLVVLAGPGEEGLLKRWRQAPGTSADWLVRPDTIGRLAAVLARCRLLLCNDSGPMHVAGAVGTPVAAVFGATSPALFGPLDRKRNRVVQAACDRAGCWVPPGRPACDRRCIDSIAPSRVIAAVSEVLQPGPTHACGTRGLSTTNWPEASPCTAAS
jgi:ADP-heptose:LPS heptosyltransferase